MDVQKSYDGATLVVKSLDLDIARGEFLTMLGPSGSGKTTCLMMLAGFESATHGEIFLDGQPINNVPPYRRDIGMVFQNYALFPHMTVGENVAFPLQVRKVPKPEVETRVKRALDMVRLGQFANRRPAQMSGGQQQRVALARALAPHPRALLLDEVTSALDPELVGEVLSAIRDLKAEGVTMLVATHEMGFARDVADEVCFLHEGAILERGAPERFFGAPERPETQRFLRRLIDAGRL